MNMNAKRYGTLTLAIAATIGIAGCSQTTPPSDVPAPADTQSAPDDAQQTDTPSGDDAAAPPADADLSATKMPISLDDAITTAKSEANGDITSIELDNDNGVWLWKIDVTEGTTEHEVRINAATGEVVSNTPDDDEDDGKPVDITLMSPEDAMKAALAAQPGKVTSWKLNWDDGAQRYDIEVRDGTDDVDVSVDVATGKATIDD